MSILSSIRALREQVKTAIINGDYEFVSQSENYATVRIADLDIKLWTFGSQNKTEPVDVKHFDTWRAGIILYELFTTKEDKVAAYEILSTHIARNEKSIASDLKKSKQAEINALLAELDAL